MERSVLIAKKILPKDIRPSTITRIVLVQFFANLFINVDMGILPAGSLLIKEDLKLDN